MARKRRRIQRLCESIQEAVVDAGDVDAFVIIDDKRSKELDVAYFGDERVPTIPLSKLLACERSLPFVISALSFMTVEQKRLLKSVVDSSLPSVSSRKPYCFNCIHFSNKEKNFGTCRFMSLPFDGEEESNVCENFLDYET